MITIRLLGATYVEVDGRELSASALRGKQRQILDILALDAGTPVPKERLADLLWDGSPPASYLGTLESYVCVLRRAMGLRAGRTSQLATTPAGYVLSVGGDVEVDHFRFQALAREALAATGATAVARTAEAVGLVRGELLADLPYADWAVRAREVFGHLLVEMCLRGAQHANGIGDFAHAAQFAQIVVDRDPASEDATRQLMVAHWFSGRRVRALTAYGQLRATMVEQLGEEPGRQSYELYLTILRDTSETGELGDNDNRVELKMLLRLLRQALDSTPGVRAPARDAHLSEVAMRALAPAI